MPTNWNKNVVANITVKIRTLFAFMLNIFVKENKSNNTNYSSNK